MEDFQKEVIPKWNGFRIDKRINESLSAIKAISVTEGYQ